MVGGLVEQQHVRLLEQDSAERHPAALAAREPRDVRVTRRQAQRVHRHVDLVIELPETERVDALLQVPLLLEEPVHLARRPSARRSGR